MATIAPQTIVYTGLIPSYSSAAGGGDQFLNDGRTFLHIKNSSSQITLTVVTSGTIGGRAIADDTITIPATTGDKMIGPFPTGLYNDTNGYVQLTYSSATGITIAAVKLP